MKAVGPPEIRVRAATAKDFDRIGELVLSLGRAYEAVDPSYALAIDFGRMWREHIEEGLKDDRIRVPVSLDAGGKIVSLLVARAAYAPLGLKAPRMGLIEAAWVEEPFRRQGRLRAMANDAMRWFEVKRATNVQIAVDHRDAIASAAWRALGFGDFQLVLRRQLDG